MESFQTRYVLRKKQAIYSTACYAAHLTGPLGWLASNNKKKFLLKGETKKIWSSGQRYKPVTAIPKVRLLPLLSKEFCCSGVLNLTVKIAC